MVVICLSECPPAVRGDLSKWLMEVSSGVYAGILSSRVRDQLWERICNNTKYGRATMVFSAPGEQKMSFRVHNTTWEPVDFEGLTLMRKPLPGPQEKSVLPAHFSKAARRELHRRKLASTIQSVPTNASYIVLDVETTGLSAARHEILEIGALRVENGDIAEEFQCLIQSENPIPEEIIRLTGISEDLRKQESIPLTQALEELKLFVEDQEIVCYNAAFDSAFLRAACKKCEMDSMKNRFQDTLPLARRKLEDLHSFQLGQVAEKLNIATEKAHRAVADCYTTMAVYEKLKDGTLK